MFNMFFVKSTILIFVVVCTVVFSEEIGEKYNNQKDKEVIQKKSNSVEASGIQCKTGSCGKKTCDCCSGYYLSSIGIFSKTYSCEKCNCGKDFNCTYATFEGIKCTCPEGFSDVNHVCKADCKTNPCKNGGRCQVKSNDVACLCKDPYSGERCENRNQCKTGSCGSKKCDCCSGYYLESKGLFAKNYTCKKCDCGKDFNCTFVSIFERMKCVCPEGFSDVNRTCKADCKTNPCKNGGRCQVKNNDVACLCKDPYSGERCENNKCSERKCQNGGKCIINEGKPVCNCTEQYDGDFCETDKCSKINCVNDGKCIINEGKPVCNCTEQYAGDFCETDKCSERECQNGGKCIISEGKPVCKCTEQYAGDFCETDKCSNLSCQNNGRCVIQGGKPMCYCTDQFTGDLCQTEISTQLPFETTITTDLTPGPNPKTIGSQLRLEVLQIALLVGIIFIIVLVLISIFLICKFRMKR